ncbi:hypothetical protein ACTFIZ_005405 [Dictyostelium cf. discoideum]
MQDVYLPLNNRHNKQYPLYNENLGNDPYGHLFYNCKKTLEFIQTNKLKNFIYIEIGGKHWAHNQLYKEEPSTCEKLSFSNLLNKWHKLATQEYIKKAWINQY